jgi:opacity protein-like surface antigen
MKKTILILILTTFAHFAISQELRLNTYGGYVFDDRVDSYFSNSSYYDGVIKGGFQWGAGLEYHIPGKGAIELQYLRQDTNAPTIYQDGGIFNGSIQNTDFDLALNWIMLNGTRYFPVSEMVEPFVGAGIGMGIFALENPENNRSSNATKLAWSVRGGTNIWLAENVAFRVQASLMSAVQSVGGGFYFGTGGSGAGLSTYSSMYQFGFEGGLVFRIPQQKGATASR